MKFSIIYPTYRPGGLDILFHNLTHQNAKVDYELIVIDDFKEPRKDLFLEKFKDIPVKYYGPSKPKCFPQSRHGQMNSWNTGFLMSTGDIIIILEDYVLLPKNSFETWTRIFTDLDTIITGVSLNKFTPIEPKTTNNYWSVWDQPVYRNDDWSPMFLFFSYWIPFEYEGFYTGIPWKVIEKLNGFYELFDYTLGQSLHEFMNRAKLAGFKLTVNHDMICSHIEHRHWGGSGWSIYTDSYRDVKLSWEDYVQKVRDGVYPIEAPNCFNMKTLKRGVAYWEEQS